jgi:hypothetical protein
MSIAIGIGWGLALVLLAVSLWTRRQRRIRNSFSSRSDRPVQPLKREAMPNASEVLVYINDDGSARELSETEKKYVDTEFSPLDGARPHIKTRYEQRNGWGNLSGFLQRKDVPVGMPINPAPSETTSQQQTPQTVADSISELIRKHGQN